MGIYFRNATLVFLMSLLLACSGDSSGNQNVEEAKAYLAGGKQKAAIIELKNALQKNGKNQEARWLLGKVYFDQGQFVDAEKELTRARELGQSEDDVLPLLSQSLLMIGELDKLHELSADNLSDSSRSFVYASQGMAFLRDGKIKEASESIEKATSSFESAYALEAKARLLAVQSKGDWALVRKQLQKVFDVDPNYAAAWSLQGDIELRSSNPELAGEAFTKAINNNSYRLNDRYKRALVRLQVKDLDGAKEDIDVLSKIAPQNSGTQYLQGLLNFYNKNIKEAITAFTLAQNDEDRYPMSLFYLATLHNKEGNNQLAEDFAYRFLAVEPDSEGGRKLLAGMKLRSQEVGEAEEAEELIRPVVEKNGEDIHALNLLSSALFKQNKTEEGVALLRKVVELQPDSPEARVRLGAGMIATGEMSGMEHVEEALKLNPQYQQADGMLMAAFLRKKDYAGALNAVDEFERKNPDNIIANNLRGEVYIAAGQIDDAKRAFEKTLSLSPGNPGANQNLALLAIKENDFDGAKKRYLDTLKHNQDHLPVILKLASLSELQGDKEGMVKYLNQALKTDPKAVQPRVLMARYKLSNGEPEQVAVLFNDLDPKVMDQPDVLNVIALAHLRQNQYHDAIALFKKIVLLKADAPQPHHYMAVAYLALGDKEKAKVHYEKAIEISPAYLAPRLELTRLFFQENDRKGAVENLVLLKKLSPENAEVYQLDAVRARLDGNQDEALELTRAAYEKAPSTRNMLVLSRQYWTMGKKELSKDLLGSWIEKHPKDLVASLELADMHLGSGDENKAADQYAKVLEVQNDNILALNNLAWLWRDTKPEIALKYAQQAAELSENSPFALDTLAVVLLKNNEGAKALRTIDDALEKLPNNPSIKYHNAMINAEVGDKAKAKKYLTELLAGKDEFPERKDAEALLKTL